MTAQSQTASVTATIHDPSGQLYNNGTCLIQFQPTFGVPGPYTVNGASFNQQPSCTINSVGVLSATVTRNDNIQPAKSQWIFTIAPNASSAATTVATPIQGGASVDITTTINNAITSNIFVSSLSLPRAYQDNEVILTPNFGGQYYNVTDNSVHVWNGSTWFTAGVGTVSPGTTNIIPKYTNGPGSVIGNSSITDDGTTVSTAENLSVGGATFTTGTFTNWLRGPDGTCAGTPSFSFTNEIGTGFIRSGTSTVQLCISGTGRFTFGAGALTIIVGTPSISLFGSTNPNITFGNPADSGITRISAKVFTFGSNTPGDTTGTVQVQSYNGMVLDASTFSNVSACITALPSSGGTCDARGPNVNLALGTIDAGTKQVTILLGPFSYTADHIVLEANFKLIGTASVNISGVGTLITSIGSNTQPIVVNNTSGLINVRAPEIVDVSFIALSGNTSQDGIKIDLSANTTLSVVDHFRMKGVNLSGFKGHTIYLKGPNTNNGSFVQFVKFDHVSVVRPSSSAESLRITGNVGQMDFYSCQFDGGAKGNGTNIYIGTESNADTTLPYSINFYSLTSQSSNIDFQGSGFNQVALYGTHQENTNIVYELDSLHTNSNNGGIIFQGGYFANAGVNAGAGRILKVTTTKVFGARLSDSTYQSVPDRQVESTTGAEVIITNNSQSQSPATILATTGIDFATNPAATMNVGIYHTVMLQTSATSITTLNSQLGPGELITFIANGTCQFATGGNIDFAGEASPLVLQAGQLATFINTDYTGTNIWRLVSVSFASTLNQTAYLTTTYTNATTTFSNVTGLTFTVLANKNYKITCDLDYQTSATTADIKLQWTGPATPTAVSYDMVAALTSTTLAGELVATAFSTSLAGAGTPSTATNLPVRTTMTLINGANAGTVQLQAAATGAGTVSIIPGSCELNQ